KTAKSLKLEYKMSGRDKDLSEKAKNFKAPEDGASIKEPKRKLTPKQEARIVVLKREAKPIEDEIGEIKKELSKTQGLTGRSQEYSIKDNLSKEQTKQLKARLKILETQLAPLSDKFLPLDHLTEKFDEQKWEEHHTEHDQYAKKLEEYERTKKFRSGIHDAKPPKK